MRHGLMGYIGDDPNCYGRGVGISWKLVNEILMPAEHPRAWKVSAGQAMRIIAVEGPQCGDLAVFNAHYNKETYSAPTFPTCGTATWARGTFAT